MKKPGHFATDDDVECERAFGLFRRTNRNRYRHGNKAHTDGHSSEANDMVHDLRGDEVDEEDVESRNFTHRVNLNQSGHERLMKGTTITRLRSRERQEEENIKHRLEQKLARDYSGCSVSPAKPLPPFGRAIGAMPVSSRSPTLHNQGNSRPRTSPAKHMQRMLERDPFKPLDLSDRNAILALDADFRDRKDKLLNHNYSVRRALGEEHSKALNIRDTEALKGAKFRAIDEHVEKTRSHMEASYQRLKMQQSLAVAKIAALTNASQDMAKRARKKENTYDRHLYTDVAPGYQEAMDNVYLDRAEEDERLLSEINDLGESVSNSAGAADSAVNNHGSDVTALEEEEGDYDSDSHDNFYKAVAQHAEYKSAREAQSSYRRGTYFGTYTPLHSMSPAARAIHEKVQAHSRNWKKEKEDLLNHSEKGSSMRMQPMSLDNLMMLKDEDEDDDDDDDDDDDEVDRVYEDTEEQIWEENGSHEPDPTKRESVHALSGQMHAHEEEYEGSLSTGDFLTPTDEGDILYRNGREQEVGREEEYNEEVVLPPEPMQDEYPDEFEDIGEGNLPPPRSTKAKGGLVGNGRSTMMAKGIAATTSTQLQVRALGNDPSLEPFPSGH